MFEKLFEECEVTKLRGCLCDKKSIICSFKQLMDRRSSVIITVSIIICFIVVSWFYYYKNYRQVELFETRKFNVFNNIELELLREELENPYLLWNTEGKRLLDFQPLSGWKLTIINRVPKRLETGTLIYFPKNFKASYPMYYENQELETSYFPTKNSMIIAKESLEWVSENYDIDSQQIVIVGEKNNLTSLIK